MTTLDDELELLDQYMRLEHERFSDRFDLRCEIDPALRGAGLRVPPMLVQPFIENAIWHGLRHKEGRGLLTLNVKDTGNSIRFEVTDDGIGRTKAAELKRAHAKASKGIANARNRIALVNSLYHAHLELHVEDLHADGTGTRVRFDVPKDLAPHG